MKSTCGGGNRLRDEILLCREKEDGFDFIQGGSLGFHLNEVKISSWLDTISSESRKRENRMDFHFVLSLLFIASFAFVLQMHRAAPIPLLISSIRTSPILLSGFSVISNRCGRRANKNRAEAFAIDSAFFFDQSIKYQA